MKSLIIFLLKNQKEWYTSKIGEYEAYFKACKLSEEYVGSEFYSETEFRYLTQLQTYLDKRNKVNQKIKKLKRH